MWRRNDVNVAALLRCKLLREKRLIKRRPLPRRHDELTGLQEAMRFMPSVQIIHRIRTRNKEKRRPVKLVVERRYGIHRIGRSLPTQFHV